MKNFESLYQFITSKIGNYSKPISLNTRLEKDLGITGDDADEFMLDFFTKYKIDYSTFEIESFFSSEGFDIFNIGGLIRKLSGKKTIKKNIYDITVGDLIRAIEVGKWIDPE